jgi:ERF superfamily protein
MATQQLDKVSIIPQDEPRAVAIPTPMDMIQKAVASGADIEMVERLMGLNERYEASQARKAFDKAIAAAKSKITPIQRNAKGHNDKRYADFAAIAKVVDPILSENGLSYRFRTEQSERISVTCILSHEAGHSEETTLAGPADTSGNKNAIQAIGSTLTYLQRYSLVQMLGLAAAADDDGKAGASVEAVTQKQADNLSDLIEANGKNRAQFLKWAKVERFEDIPATAYDACVAAIEYKAPAK